MIGSTDNRKVSMRMIFCSILNLINSFLFAKISLKEKEEEDGAIENIQGGGGDARDGKERQQR